MRILFCLFYALIAVLAVKGEEIPRVEMLHRNWSTREGLPQDRVRAMVRTRDGYLWLGTDAGLTRFDGTRFKTFGLQEGLKAVTVLCLLEARDGTLWVGTLAGGVSAIRDGKVVASYGQEEGLPSVSVFWMAEDPEGHLWAGDRSGFAWLKDGKFTPVPGSPNDGRVGIRSLFCDHRGTMWVSESGAELLQWNSGRWIETEKGTPPLITAMCEDQSGRMWFLSANQGLCVRDGDGWRKHPLPDQFKGLVNSISAASDGTIWVSLYRKGVCGFRDRQFFELTVRGERFLDLGEVVLTAPGNLLFLGTSSNGLYALTPSRITMGMIDVGESNRGANIIGGLAEIASDELLVGTQGRGLFRWKKGKATPLDPGERDVSTLFVNTIVPAREGGFWVGTGRGLYRYEAKDADLWSMVRTPYQEVWEVIQDRIEGLWVGCGNGMLGRVTNGVSARVPFGSETAAIKGLAEEADGTLWVGTRGNGLYRLSGLEWQKFGKTHGLLSESIRVVYVAADGSVWVGTAGGGLFLFQGERFISVTTKNGLPDDTVSQITLDDENRLWVGTLRGYAVFSPDEVRRISEEKLDGLHPMIVGRFDGLPSEESTIVPPLRLKSGAFAFATTQGFAMLRPGDFQLGEQTPPVLVDSLTADGKIASINGEPAKLPAGTGRVEVAYTAFHFEAPERVQFRTRLVGLESKWGNVAGQRSVEYRNLMPGRYLFEVEATLGNGKWTPVPAMVGFEILPFFWQTLTFRVLLVAVLTVAIALAVRRMEQKRVQRRIEALERKHAVDAERARIARDLHDDLGSSLTQVALLSELVSTNIPGRPERASQHASEIFTTAQEMTRSLDEIVWAVDPTQDTIERFAIFLGTFVQNYARVAGLHARFDFPEILPSTPLPANSRHHLYLAIKEVLHNVVKHAQADEVQVAMKVDPQRLTLTIADNGKGFDAENLVLAPGADGLRNLQSRLQQVGGTCKRVSIPGSGTAVEMRVPLE